MSDDGQATLGMDPGWIAEQLAAGDNSPSAVEFSGFIGTGQMSRTARYSLDWPDGSGPASIVVKMPSTEAVTRAAAFTHGVYWRECNFYRAILPFVDVTAPSPHAVYFDEQAQDFAIVLEDLVDSRQGDQFSEPTDDQLASAVSEAVALHAPLWGATDIEALSALRTSAEAQAAAASRVTEFLPAVFERLGSGLDNGITELLEQFALVSDRWALARATDTTLVHGDFRPDNFMFGDKSGAPPLTIVDWQTLGLGIGVTDVAYLLGGSLEPERRADVECELLGVYCEQLAGKGVTYPIDQCLSDSAIASLHGVVIAIAATTVAAQTERGDALFTLMLNRHGRHALDLNALDEVKARS